jgi:anti-anti-sigma factor
VRTAGDLVRGRNAAPLALEMEITLDSRRPALVLRLAGRFDGDGAPVFDGFVEALNRFDESWILDFSEVRYISSLGLRSLMKAEKRLRTRHEMLVLAGLSRPVRHVLEMARLHTVLRLVASVDEALLLARAGSVAPDRALRSTRQGRTCATWLLGGQSLLETWGPPPETLPRQFEGDQLATLTIEDLACAVGFGGFGATRDQACEATGRLLIGPGFAGLRPAGTDASDFIVPERPSEALVHVASALGLDGSPHVALQVASDEGFSISDLVDDRVESSAAEGALPALTAMLALVTLADDGRPAILLLIAADRTAFARTENAFHVLAGWLTTGVPGGRLLTGRAALLAPSVSLPSMAADPADALSKIVALDSLEDIVEIDPAWRITSALAWGYLPSRLRDGREKLLNVDVDDGTAVLDEWETITRRLYRDCRRVVLTPLHGGFMSNTFRVTSYDAEGRRLLPTVLKIGGLALTEREEAANRKYVQTFILNNSTTLLGGAAAGEWAGLRYNFLGVTGPDSSLEWLRNHYQRRPVGDVLRLVNTLFTCVLKPWYGQPRWEPVALYAEHDPRRLFPTLCEAAAQVLGVSADTERLPCPELGIDILNPYHFLQHEFPRRRQRSRLWYTSICHGDLNMQNVLVDERDNIYVIDFSETRPRNIVSDFARLEPILKFELVPIDSEADLRLMLQFERGLLSTTALNETPPLTYSDTNAAVDKAHQVITLLRRLADTATIFETDMVPYWLALLEWTLPVVVYRQANPWQKRYAALSAGLLCEAIASAEAS